MDSSYLSRTARSTLSRSSARPRHPLHRLAKGDDRRLGLLHQGVGMARQLVALLDQLARRVPRVLRAPADFRGNEVAGEQMLANRHRQVGMAARAQVRAVVEEISGELVLPEVLAAGSSGRDGVFPAEHEEQGPFLVGQLERSPAVEVNDLVGVERDRIVGMDRLYTSRARRLRQGST